MANNQNLFDTIERITGHIAIESEMFEIIDAVKKDATNPAENTAFAKLLWFYESGKFYPTTPIKDVLAAFYGNEKCR